MNTKPKPADVAAVSPMRQRRLELDMRLTELSGLTGLDIGLLSRVETGQRRPTIEAAVKIARGLGRPVDVLFPGLLMLAKEESP